MATPSLPRTASARADAPSPFSSNPAHQPVSTPTTPAAASASSFGCMATTPTDTPPVTPKEIKTKSSASAASSYASLWSPRKLMQRAARAFRGGRSRRRTKYAAGDEQPTSATSKCSDRASAVSLDSYLAGSEAGRDGGAAADKTQEERENHPDEVVLEKIIHEANHQQEPVATNEPEAYEKTADEKDTGAAAEEEEEEPKKGTASPPPEAVADATNADADVTDKFVMVAKEAIKKREEEVAEADTPKKEAMRRFQGRRVRTAMEARPESEQPRRREAARSNNDVIEEARSKLLEMRQLSRVRALVGAFETVMDAKPASPAAAGKPQHHHRMSA